MTPRVFSAFISAVLVLPHLVVGLQRQAIVKRQDSQLDRLDFCYGEDSICSIGNDLYSQCDAYSNDYQNPNPWYKCLCSNGYVAVNEACYWCQLVYDLDVSYAGSANKDGCSSASVPIAPIPSSVLSIGSQFNATYTGPPPPGDATATPKSSTASATDSGYLSETTTSETTTSSAGAGGTYFGGSTAIETFSGGAVPTTTGTPSATATATDTAATSSAGSSAIVAATHKPVTTFLAFLLYVFAGL